MSCGCSNTNIPDYSRCSTTAPGNQRLPNPRVVSGNGLVMSADWVGQMTANDSGQLVLRNGDALEFFQSADSGLIGYNALTGKVELRGDGFFDPGTCDIYGLPGFGVLTPCSDGTVRELRFQRPPNDSIGVIQGLQSDCGGTEFRQVNIVPGAPPACTPSGYKRPKYRTVSCGTNGTQTEWIYERELTQNLNDVLDLDTSDEVDEEVNVETMELAIWQKLTCTGSDGGTNITQRLRKIDSEKLKEWLSELLSGRNQLVTITEALVGSSFQDGSGGGAGIDLTSFIRNLVATTSPSGTFNISALPGTPIPAGTKTVQCLARCITDTSGGGSANAYAKVNGSVKIEDHTVTGGENSSTDHVWFDVALDTNGAFTYDIGATIGGDAAAYADIWITGYWN